MCAPYDMMVEEEKRGRALTDTGTTRHDHGRRGSSPPLLCDPGWIV